MSDILIRNVDPALKKRLKARARANERSLSDEVKALLERELAQSPKEKGLGTQIRELFADIGGVELDLPPREMGREPPDFR